LTHYRKTELVGSSKTSLSDAIETAIARAAKTLRHVEWFEVNEIRGHVRDGKVEHYQVRDRRIPAVNFCSPPP
jgi:flavin-binding protein dodecin